MRFDLAAPSPDGATDACLPRHAPLWAAGVAAPDHHRAHFLAAGDAVTPGGTAIADTTTLASGELFRFTVTLDNCDGAATVGASLPLTLNVEGGGDTRVDLEIESVAIGAKLI